MKFVVEIDLLDLFRSNGNAAAAARMLRTTAVQACNASDPTRREKARWACWRAALATARRAMQLERAGGRLLPSIVTETEDLLTKHHSTVFNEPYPTWHVGRLAEATGASLGTGRSALAVLAAADHDPVEAIVGAAAEVTAASDTPAALGLAIVADLLLELEAIK